MDDSLGNELPDDLDPGVVDPFLVAQAARTHAQRASEKAGAVQGELAELKEHTWTKKEHDDFWEDAQADNAKQRHRLNVLLTFAAILLGVMVLLVWWFFWHLDTVDETTERRINEIVRVAGESCHQNNDQLANTRQLYQTLSEATENPSVSDELRIAAERLPDPIDCSVFDPPVNP